MKKFLLFFVLSKDVSLINAQSQQKPLPHINQYIDFATAIGNSEGTAAFSYVHDWRFGKRKRLEAGLGLRLTSYLGTKREFYTAPARLARTTTVPFAIVFAGHEEKNLDTLTLQRPF